MNISFSVVIPLYNKKQYVLRAIDSVLRQSYRDFELIIVNDGSTDGSEKVITQVEDPRIKIINQTNQGVSAARNRGIAEAKNEFIAFLDADDEWRPDFLIEVKRLILKYPAAGVYGINHIYKHANGRETINRYPDIFKENVTDGYIEDYFGIFAKYSTSPFSNSGCCMPKKVLLGVDGYKPGVRMTEDSDLWCRIALSHPIAFTKKPLCTYHLETPTSSGYLFDSNEFEVSRMLQQALERQCVPEKYIRSVKKLIAFQRVSHAKRALLLSYRQDAFKILQDRRIVFSHPLQFVILLFCTILPNRLLKKLNNFRKFHQF